MNTNYINLIPQTLVESSAKENKPYKALLFGLITSLTHKFGYCNARNATLAGMLSLHKNTISGLINELKEDGWLIISYEDTKSMQGRKIYSSMTIGDPSLSEDTPYTQERSPLNPDTEPPTSRDGTTNNRKLKEKEKEELPLSLSHKLKLLDKTGTAMPSKKNLMDVVGLSEWKAKDIAKVLKRLNYSERKQYLKDLLAGADPGVGKTYSHQNKTAKPVKEVSLPEGELENLKTLADYYEKKTGRRPEITQENKYDYYHTRKKYYLKDMMYVIKNCFKAVSRGENFYSITFDQALKEKTIRRMIQQPLLAEIDKE